MMQGPQDSTGQPLHVGDRINWYGRICTIRAFHAVSPTLNAVAIVEDPTLDVAQMPLETQVDLIKQNYGASSDADWDAD